LSITDGATDYGLLGSEIYADDTIKNNLRAASKFMGSTPDTSVSFGPTGSSVEPGLIAVSVYSGVDPDTPLDVAVQTVAIANTNRANPPAITPETPGAFILCVGSGSTSTTIGLTAFSSSDLTDFTSLKFSDFGNPYNCLLGMGHKTDWSSGEFDPAAFTGPGDSTALSASALSIALRPAPSSGGNIKVWNGSAWVAKPVKVWNGSSWVAKPVKRWNGSAWITTPY
jgi:hypothetical protein